jgi:secretion/DNA translocation related TadE-like protein
MTRSLDARRPLERWWRMRSADRGSATILTVALVCVLMCCGVVGLAVVQAALVTARAQMAADLAALAGAQALADPCGASAAVAEANGAVITECRVEGPDVVVAVELPAPPLVERMALAAGRPSPVVSARARAGY